MHYLLIDHNPRMVAAWREYFDAEAPTVTVMEGDLTAISGCDAIVSPANSFGFMDGGIDNAISLRLGWDLQTKLQAQIQALPEGELLVGKALVLPTGDALIPFLISAPTMRVPMSVGIAEGVNAYLAMKATLIAARMHPDIETVAIPGFCTGIGKMMPEIAARQMHMAFREIERGEKRPYPNFAEATKGHWEINPQARFF